MPNLHLLIFRTIARLEEQLSLEIQAIMHHRDFQRLEASWRGLAQLAKKVKKNKPLLLKVLSLSKKELSHDLLGAIDFDHSTLFKKIYSEELDHPGGEPFGIVLLDFYFSHQSDRECSDPISVLRLLSHLAKAALTPVILGVGPELLDLNNYKELSPTQSLESLYLQPSYQRWVRLRQEEGSQFVGFTLPRIMMRALHESLFFQEKALKHDDYLWGNAVYAYAVIVMNCFLEQGWFSGLRGSVYKSEHRHYFESDEFDAIAKPSTEVLITDLQERALDRMGLMALRDYFLFESQIFFSSQSLCERPFMLNYLLCVARFGHYIKVMMRDKVGLFLNAQQCEDFLQSWISAYCVESGASESMKSKCPLQAASVQVSADVRVGHYVCRVLLRPHDPFDEVQSELAFVTYFSMGRS